MPLSVSSALSLLTGSQGSQFGSSLDGDAGDFMSLLDNNGQEQDVEGGPHQNGDLLAANNATPSGDKFSTPVQVPSAVFASNQPAPSQPITTVAPQHSIQETEQRTQDAQQPAKDAQHSGKLTPVTTHASVPHISSKSQGHHSKQDNSQNNVSAQDAQAVSQTQTQTPAQPQAVAPAQATTQAASSGSGSGSSSGAGTSTDNSLQGAIALTATTAAPLAKPVRKALENLSDLLSLLVQAVAVQAPQTPVASAPTGTSSGDGAAVDLIASSTSPAQPAVSSGSGSGVATDPLEAFFASLETNLSANGDAFASSASGSAAATGTLPSSPVTLLSDIRSMLQQLQSLMQQGGTAQAATETTETTPVIAANTAMAASDTGTASGSGSAGGDATPPADSVAQQTLLGALTKDISALRSLLNPAAARAATARNITLTSTVTASSGSGSSQNSGQTNGLQNLVNSTLSLVKNLLARPDAANAPLVPQANNQAITLPLAGAADLTSQLKDWLQSHKSSSDGDASDKLSTVSAATAAALPTPVAKPLADGPQLFMPVIAATATATDTGSDNSGSDNNSNNNAQPTVAPAAAAGTAQAPAPGAATMNFAKVLDQMSSSSSSLTDQVTFQVKTAIADGSSKISIQLSPEDLGKLDIKLDIGADGKPSSITITADNKTTLDLLQKDAGGLQRALSDAGLNMGNGSMSFNLRHGQQDQGQNNNAQAAMTYQKAAPEDEEAALPVGVISSSYVVNVTEGLDIRI